MLFRIPGETYHDENGEPFVEPERTQPWGTPPDALSWAAYILGHPERLPRGGGETWADVSPAESRRVERNYQRWRARRLAWQAGRPVHFRLDGDVLMVEVYPGRWRPAG